MNVQRLTNLPPLPRRAADAHKGSFGRVLIVAGSPGMTGAAALSGWGALRGGAGLVTVATPQTLIPIVASIEPAFLTLPLRCDEDGHLKMAALKQIREELPRLNALAIGPGLGTAEATQKIVADLYATAELPMVVDADGLNCLVQKKVSLSTHAGPRIFTPHPGEFSRLCGLEITRIQSDRESPAVEFAGKHKIVLVLKGQGTIVTDGARLYTNTTGNSGMATGGTGDVLTGLIAALLAQHMPPLEAAQLGIFLHGRAGDLAAEENSQPGMIASDLARLLGRAWQTL